jgi:hypothetical protein
VSAAPPLACQGCNRQLPAAETADLCLACRTVTPENLAAIRRGELPPGSGRASVCPDGEPCTRCKAPHRHLTTACWNGTQRLCTGCCGIVANEHDSSGWPAPLANPGDPR